MLNTRASESPGPLEEMINEAMALRNDCLMFNAVVAPRDDF